MVSYVEDGWPVCATILLRHYFVLIIEFRIQKWVSCSEANFFYGRRVSCACHIAEVAVVAAAVATVAATVSRTTKDGRSLTISSRMLLQKTTNNKTIESYHYDADGKLTGAEADVTTWEERNTEIYSWLNNAPAPFEVLRRPSSVPPRARTVPPEDHTLVRMASAVHRVPALAWSGSTVISYSAESSLNSKKLGAPSHLLPPLPYPLPQSTIPLSP